jgi:molybdopterin-containing oxidoreductase family iron-sulfur binding subunit
MLADLGEEDLLIVHETNPAYSLPQARKRLERVGRILYLGSMMNETAAMADWVLPVLSPLQAWGDYEPWTGTHCLLQPTTGPLYEAQHSGDVLMALAAMFGRPFENEGQVVPTFQEWLRLQWRRLHERIAPDMNFEAFWQQALRNGGVFEETVGADPRARPNSSVQNPADIGQPQGVAPTNDLQLWLWPSILLFDGHLANRGWLQEAPESMSTIAWQSWVDLSPQTARRLKIANGDVVEVSHAGGSVRAPARVTEDVADNVAALAFGQGHTALGEQAAGRGVNAFALSTRPEGDSLFGTVELRKTGARVPLIALSATQDQHGRDILRWTARAVSRVEEIVLPLPEGYDPRRDLYSPHAHRDHRWAMVVDLDRCIGCGACAVACYAENNIAVMGPGPVAQGREMAWLKVPPYRHPGQSHRVGFLPLPCQHCDAAPCEPVCPVFAAVHNEQGLNAQIYNRCIGTRYCANNCPYKVRRFNWFDPRWREPLPMQLNPDVAVRCRGVMEKCTFCVQRIQYAERRAKVAGRSLRDGAVQPACVQSCPTRTFVFGDLLDADSEVRKLLDHPRRYQLLGQLNTKPAVIYLKRIQPDKPELV